MWLTIGLIVGALVLLYVYLTWNFNHWKKLGVPGPKPTVLLGNLPSGITQKQNMAYDIDTIYREYRKKGCPFAGIYNVRNPNLLIIDPTLVKDIFVKNFNNFHDNEFADMIDKEVDPLFGRNPFMLSGEEWKEKRSEVTPAFTPARIKALYPLIDDVTVKMVKYLSKEIEKKTDGGISSREICAKFTTDVVSSCIFAVDANSFSGSEEEAVIRKMGKTLMQFTYTFLVYLTMITIFPVISRFYKMPMVPKKHEAFFTKLMEDAVKHREENKVDRKDYLDHLMNLKEKKGISALDMAAHGITFFLDGFETSSVVMSQTLYEIATNKDVQVRLRKEIQDNLDTDGNISFEKLNDLPYLEQVFCESLRLNPPALFLSKKCTEPIEIEGLKGHKLWITKGSIMMIPIYSLHRDPDHWPEPLKFDPERFALETGGAKHFEDNGMYLPFGNGPRICLGRRFASTQVKKGIVEVVRNFELSVNPKTKEPLTLDPKEFLYVPIGGIWLDFKAL